MHATIQKPLDEIIGYLKPGEKVFVVGCGNCAAKCHSGGEPETEEMAERLRQKGIPVEKILKSKQDNILKLEDHLKGRVYGQDESLHEIAETLISSHAGLSDNSRPLGSFLLKGPSGVGKTD